MAPALDRYRLPAIANRLIDAIADTPSGLVGRVAARRYGTPIPGTPTTTFTDTPGVRLLIAPVNYSGQAHSWAQAIERALPASHARTMAIEVPGGFSFDADIVVPVPVYHNDADWQRRQFEAVASAATHVLVEAEEAPFGRLLGRDVRLQVTALLNRGVDVAFMAHGTDIRIPSKHIERSPWSLYTDPAVYSPRLETVALRNVALLESMGRPVFVSTPDLLADAPFATWCPVVVDPARWAAARPAPRPARPLRVVHTPSQSVHKGTPLITPTLEKLAAEGVIDYRLVTGVASADMPAVFHEADVLLDQFRAGSYGVAACEAMAAGCVVVGHVLDDVRDIVETTSGSALPLVEATPDTLERTLRDLAADSDRVATVSQAGIDFVAAVHDGRLSAQVLTVGWLADHDPDTRKRG